MKKAFYLSLVFLVLIFSQNSVMAQAKKPTLMVIPSDAWCKLNGYMTTYDNQGTSVEVPDYKKALQSNTDLLQVITTINKLMTDRGFPLKDLESSLKKIDLESAQDAMTSSSTSNSSISENPVDKLKKVAKADIWIQLTWTINQSGPKKSISFILRGLDAYTDKQIAAANGTGAPSFTTELPLLLEEAALAHMDNFNIQLQTYFDEMFVNGREVVLNIKKFNAFNGDLESQYGGEELGSQIEKWVTANTVKSRFNTTDASSTAMLFEQVRIPILDAAGKALDTRSWAKGLQKYLKETFAIESKLMMNGLGQATIIIGEK